MKTQARRHGRASEKLLVCTVVMPRQLIAPIFAMLIASCARPGAPPAEPRTTPAPSSPTAVDRCPTTRVVACQCAQGKGYRRCEAGHLGECVCKRADKPEPTIVSEPVTRDPSATPPNVKAPPVSAQRTPSGLAYIVLRRGSGTIRPGPTTAVTVHYAGWTTDGKMFDSSYKRNRSARFPLNRVIKGWTEGLQLMVEGDKFRFWMPANLAYGNKPGRPMGMLVFDVELLRVH